MKMRARKLEESFVCLCVGRLLLSISLGWWTVSIYFMTAHVPPLKQCWHTNRLNALLVTARYHTMDWSNHFSISSFTHFSFSNKHSSRSGSGAGCWLLLLWLLHARVSFLSLWGAWLVLPFRISETICDFPFSLSCTKVSVYLAI